MPGGSLLSDCRTGKDPALYVDSACSHQIMNIGSWTLVKFALPADPAQKLTTALHLTSPMKTWKPSEVRVTSVAVDWLPATGQIVVQEEFEHAAGDQIQACCIKVLNAAEGTVSQGPREFQTHRVKDGLSEERLTSSCKTRRLVARGSHDVVLVSLPSLKELVTMQYPMAKQLASLPADKRNLLDYWHQAAWMSHVGGGRIAIAWRLRLTTGDYACGEQLIVLYTDDGTPSQCIRDDNRPEWTQFCSSADSHFIVLPTPKGTTILDLVTGKQCCAFASLKPEPRWSADGHFMVMERAGPGLAGVIQVFELEHPVHSTMMFRWHNATWSPSRALLCCPGELKIMDAHSQQYWEPVKPENSSCTYRLSPFSNMVVVLSASKSVPSAGQYAAPADASHPASTAPVKHAETCLLEHYNLHDHEHLKTGKNPKATVGHYDDILDAGSLAWNPSLKLPKLYAISDKMSGLHLVDAAKHCMLKSYSSHELFSEKGAAVPTLPAVPAPHSVDASNSTASSGKQAKVNGPLKLMWSTDGLFLYGQGTFGGVLLSFGS